MGMTLCKDMHATLAVEFKKKEDYVERTLLACELEAQKFEKLEQDLAESADRKKRWSANLMAVGVPLATVAGILFLPAAFVGGAVGVGIACAGGVAGVAGGKACESYSNKWFSDSQEEAIKAIAFGT